MGPTVAEIKSKLQAADAAEFAVLERSLVADTRKGVRAAVESARRRLAVEAQEAGRDVCLPKRYRPWGLGGRP